MASVNRKATKDEMAHAMEVIREAFPEFEPVFGGHSSYGGHRAPRTHTISFRLRDQWGKYHSNIIWLMPDDLSTLTVAQVKRWVKKGSSRSPKMKKHTPRIQ